MTTLLHLVSEQTMQNLLPILALKPNIIVQVRSRSEKYHQAAEKLKNAVHAMSKTLLYRDLNPEFFDWKIDEDSPSVERSKSKVGEALSLWPGAIVNITGGTKQMSVGAYLAADYQRELMLYCDTAERRFVPAGKYPLPKLPSFQTVAASLTVEAVMAAHGTPPANWKFDRATDALRAVGRTGYAARLTDPSGCRAFGETVREHFRLGGNRIPNSPSKLKDLVNKPLPAAAPALNDFLDALVAASMLCREGSNGYKPAVPPEKSKVEQLANLLDGSWLELYVLDLLLARTDRWSDPHWSVEPRQPSEAAFGETDVVCVNVDSAALQIISCKSSLRQPLETLEALAQRRRDMGGTFAKATLAVLHVADNERQKLTNWARLLNVELLIGDEITAAFTT
jgi:hypothetical protein